MKNTKKVDFITFIDLIIVFGLKYNLFMDFYLNKVIYETKKYN